MHPPSTVAEWVAIAGARGTAAAIRGIDRPALSYERLAAQIGALGDSVRALGVTPRDAVLVALPDGPDALVAIVAASAAGAALPVAAHEDVGRIVALLDELPVKAIIATDRLCAALDAAARQRGISLCRIVPDASAAGLFGLEPTVSAAAGSADGSRPALGDTALLIPTSGTTSAPRIVAVSHESLFASLAQMAAWTGLGPSDRSLCLMPLTHLHALLRSSLPVIFSGGEAILAPGFDEGRVVGWINTLRPTYLTAAPGLYRGILRALNGGSAIDARVRMLVCGSDKIDETTILAVERAFDTPLRQFYVLSETAPLIAMADTALPPPKNGIGRINPIWSVVALDREGRQVGAGMEGEIAVRGGFINPLAGRNPPAQHKTADGYLLTGDLGTIDPDGVLTITGRVDDRIHRGGEKIAPGAVESVLLAHPGVREAAVFGIPDAVLGQRVGAVIVPVEGRTVTPADLQAFAAARLFSYMVPETIVIAAELPVSPTGKVARSRMAAALGLDAPAPAAEPASPSPLQDDTERALHEIYCRRLKRTDVGRETSFSELGGDSFGAIELLFELEDRFGVTIPPATFIGGSSIAAVAALLRARAPGKPALKLVPLNAGGRLPPLFIPYGPGASVGYAGAISEALGPEQPIHCFQAPAGDHDPAEPESMEEKAAKMIELIAGVQPHGPYYLIGYSFQSHVAYEIAQQLHDRGEAVAFLGIIDDSADLERRRPGVENFPPKKRTTSTLNHWAIERYVPKPYAGRITLFRANIPAEIYQADPTAGWGELALGGVETFDAPGDHANLVTRDGFGWGSLLGVVLARARRSAALQPPGAKELARAVRQARGIATGKTTRHTIDARVAAKRGDRAGEIAAYRKALSGGDAPRWARRNLGHALIQNGQIDAGIKLLEETLAGDPWPLRSAVGLADVYVAHGRQDRLAKLRETAREVLADDPQVMLQWGHLCRIAGDFAEAEAAMRRAIVLADRAGNARDYSADVRMHLADLLAGRARVEEAIVVAREAFEMFPSDAGRCMRVAALLARSGNRAEAANWYRRALEIEPKLEEARAALVALAQRG